MVARTSESCTGFLAWAGWQMRVPKDWRPLRLEGDWTRGSVITGDAEKPIMQVKWWRPKSRRFNASRWMRRRMKSVKGKLAGRSDVPAPQGFANVAWSTNYRPRSGGAGSLWYGYAPGPGLVIEVLTAGSASKRDQHTVAANVLPRLQVSPADRPTRWAVFGASFETPPGFVMTHRRIHLGDVAIWLRSPGRQRLMVRQVYPAELALARRPLAKWLRFQVFKEHRVFRPDAEPEPWSVTLDGRSVEGVRRIGRKALPFPLGFLGPRRSRAAVLHDTELDRLLIAEHDSTGADDDRPLTAALTAMNWATPAPGGRR